MDIRVDLDNETVVLADPANFRAFQVTKSGTGDSAAVAALLAASGAGHACDDEDHVWISRDWLVAQATESPAAAPDPATPEEWAVGFAKMVDLAAKMGWLDDDATHIKAHIEP